ncbi:DALR anticodon-binding domain-containing protein 3-like [Oncorhynchus clarkii lewisi]|uniref:DALR anticodon-binding domain-containing protein 3-like n=1 Tax=Oncorhynchus clarkii lewisi TaxID=490388 RepID=UPI0039B97BED
MENIEETPFRITHTVQALGSALRGEPENVPDANGLGSGDRISSEPEKLWFKESSAKNLRNRDFLSPTTVLNTLYADGQVEESDITVFLRLLGIDWPTVPISWINDEREENILEALQNSPYREREETDGGRRESEGKNTDGDKEEMLRVNLKRVFQEEQLPGYDPSLGSCTVQRDSVSHLAQLDRATAGCTVSTATAVHVTSCQDEFRQQQIAMLWRASGATRHLVCGPMKTLGTHLSAAQYLQLRRVQMKEASEIKYGEQVQDQTWDDIIKVMTSATVRFELLSTVHRSPVTLDVQREGSLSTKGPRGGVFVMYNCARLHTVVLNMPLSKGEWLLLFDYLIPFSELLDQTGQTLGCDGGARVNLKTERICKFLVSLSKDFSSYYNRVHVLGEPLPHLFNQMFCRLQLLRALRELYHSALDTLHLPPIPQL